jgi:hypothetical protein
MKSLIIRTTTIMMIPLFATAAGLVVSQSTHADGAAMNDTKSSGSNFIAARRQWRMLCTIRPSTAQCSKDTAIYCVAEKSGLEGLEWLALRT